MMKNKWLLGLSGGVLLLLVLLLLLIQPTRRSTSETLQGPVAVMSSAPATHYGKPAPDFALPDVNGATVKLSDYQGKRPVLLFFWGFHCPSCQAVKPRVARMRETIPDDRLEILAINVGTGGSYKRLQLYAKAHPTTYTILYDKEAEITAGTYGILGIPMFLMVNREGLVTYEGVDLPKDIRRYLD